MSRLTACLWAVLAIIGAVSVLGAIGSLREASMCEDAGGVPVRTAWGKTRCVKAEVINPWSRQ